MKINLYTCMNFYQKMFFCYKKIISSIDNDVKLYNMSRPAFNQSNNEHVLYQYKSKYDFFTKILSLVSFKPKKI